MEGDVFEDSAKAYLGVKPKEPKTPSSGWWTPDRVSYAVDHLKKNAGLSDAGALGLVSRWAGVEANGGPGSVNPSSGAVGIGQWLGTRKRGVPADFDGQLSHAARELNTTERAAAKRLRAAQTPQDAAIGASMFERAEGYDPKTGRDNFVGSTIRTMNSFGGVRPQDPFEASATQYLANTPTQSTSAQADPFEASAQAYLDNKGGQKITPTVAAPVTVQPPPIAPVPEPPATIQAQAEAAARPDNNRAGVLLAPGETPKLDDPQWTGFGAFHAPDGRVMMVNLDAAKKLKLKDPEHIQSYLTQNPKAIMTLTDRQAADVGNATGGNQPVVSTTLMKGGVPVEATSTVVTKPEDVSKEAKAQQQQFPHGQTGLTSTNKIVTERAKHYTADSGVISDVPEPEQPVTFGTDEDLLAKAKIAAAHNPQTTVEREFANLKGRIASATSDVIAPPKDLNEQQANAYIKGHLAAKYGAGKFDNFQFFDGYHPGNPVRITYGDLQHAGIDTNPLISQKVAETRTENPQPDLRAVPYDFASESAKDINVATEKAVGAINPLLPESVTKAAGGFTGQLAATPGELGGIVGGIIKTANEYSPSMNAIEEILSNGGTRKVELRDPTVENLKKFYEDSEAMLAQTGDVKDGKPSIPTTLFRMAGATPKIAIVSSLPGGMIGGFALEGAAISKLEGGTNADVLKAAGTGAAQGAIFKFFPAILGKQLGEVGNIVKAGYEVPAIGLGSYTVGRITGQPDEDNLINSGAIALMHGYGKLSEGKVAAVRDTKGNEAYLKNEDGKIVTVEPQKADIELVADPKNQNETNPPVPSQPAPLEEKPLVQAASTQVPAQVTDKTATDVSPSGIAPTAEKGMAPETPTEKPADANQQPVAPETKTVPHPDPAIDGKPVIAETADGKVVVANPENKAGVSVVKDRSENLQSNKETQQASASEAKAEPDVGLREKKKVFTERGTEADITPAVVDVSDIITSLDPNYPAELQPRDRSRVASKAQISDIANNLKPEFLDDSPKASDGRPLVVPMEIDGKTKYVVISGNGRSAAIKHAYDVGNEPSKAYAEFTRGKEANQLERPVYVGKLAPETDLQSFSREANESAVAQMSSTEQAKADAEKLGAGALSEFVPSEDGSIHAAANRNFIRKFVQKVAGKTEQGALVDENGQLSQDGIRRVRNAIFAKAYGERAVSRLAESTDDNIKRATNALLKVAPKMADLNEHVEGGTRHPGLSISHDVAAALEKFSTLKEEGTDVGTYLKQQSLFGDDLTPLQKRILVEFDNHRNSSKAIAGILDNYIHLAHELGDPKQTNLFGEPIEANSSTLFREAVLQYEQGNEPRAKQTNLLDTDQGRAVQSETREAPKADREAERSVPEVRDAAKPTAERNERLKPFEKNTVVTSDAVQKARDLLKKKSTQLNAGIDPEELKAFATIGAAYVEAGARKFADFSKAMIDEFGNQIKPHLEKIYGMVREAHKFEGMDEPPNVTSIKNASVNADRAARGESPLEQKVKSVSDPETWNEANARFRTDPNVGMNLVAELSHKIRPVDRLEQMMLQQERVKRTQAFDRATDEANNAATDAEYTAAKLKQNIARAQLDDLEQVAKDVGTVGAQSFRIRQLLLAHDYSLARMEARAKSRLPRGEKLSEEQLATIKDQHDRIKDLEKQLEEHNRKQDDVANDEYFRRLFKGIDKSASAAKKQGVGVVDFISQQAKKARERQAAKGHQFSAGLDPRDLYDYALIGAEHLAKGIKAGADWTAEMVKEFGEAIKPHLEDVRKRAEAIYAKHEKALGEPKKLSPREIVAKASKNAIEEIKSENLLLTDEQAAAKFRDEQKGLVPEKGLVGKLVEAHVRDGKKDLTEVITAVKEDLKDVYPDASERDIRDAFSDYGKTKFPSADEVKRSVSELRRLSQLTSAIEDANSGQPPKKTGFQRPEPTQPIRDKIKELDAAMREAGIEPSEADQLASTNKARVTALKNQIEDIERQIETGIKPPKGKPVATNAEVDALRKKRDELKAQLPEEDQTVQKQELYKRNLERQINKLTTQIQTGEQPEKGKPTPTTPEIERLKIQRDALKAQLPEADRSISDAQKLATRKKMIAKRIGELQQKMATGDYTRTVRKPLTLDAEATRLLAEQNVVKRQFEKGQMKADKEERYRLNPQERYKDWFVHYLRESVLSSPGALGKLTSAALETTGITAGEELIGHGLQKVLPGLAKQAGVESTYGMKSTAFIKNEAAAIAKGFTNLITDVGRKVSTGKLDFEDAYGPVKMPEELVSWMSRVHGGLKTIPMRSAFERYSARLNEVYMAKGIDVTDPLVQFEIGNKAFLKAQEQVFLNANAVSKFMGNLGRMLGTPDENGKVSYKKTAGALLLGSELPVVRVPTNLILRGGRAITGLPVGLSKLAVAYARGIDKLPEKQADLIIKQIKQGTPGAAIALLGYFATAGSIPGVQIGGFYRKDAPKKKEGDVPYGAARVFGVDIPALVMHHPLFEALQFGASVRQVVDEVETKGSGSLKTVCPRGRVKGGNMGNDKRGPLH
jgi:hypothetical protein